MPTDQTPPHVPHEPKLPPGVVLSDKQKMAKTIVTQVLGMVQSQWNVVIFRNMPYVWLQLFCGLCLQMPTIIVIRKVDAPFIPLLKHKLVKAFFQIDNFKESETEALSKKIARFIKQHPQTKK